MPADGAVYAFQVAFNDRDFDAIAAMYADDVRFEDHRPGMATTVIGRDAQMEQMRVMVDLGMYQGANVLIADRGSWKLLRVPWTNRNSEAPLDVDSYLLIEYGPVDEVRTVHVYDGEQLSHAREALERYAASPDSSDEESARR